MGKVVFEYINNSNSGIILSYLTQFNFFANESVHYTSFSVMGPSLFSPIFALETVIMVYFIKKLGGILDYKNLLLN